MDFDSGAYAKALDEFLMAMEQIPSHDHPAIGENMKKLCQLLRMAKVKVVFYENTLKEQLNQGDELVFYTSGEPVDEHRIYIEREVTGGGNVACYTVYQAAGDKDWTEDELNHIKVFVKMVFVFNGRARVMNIAEKMMFFDRDMGIHNLSYFMNQMGKLIGRGVIEKYGIVYFNLKGFSTVNAQVGRERGTEVMRSFMHRLQGMLSKEEIVGRIGGDNFICLFYKENLEKVKKYLQGTGIVYDEETGEKVLVSASAGYYMIPNTVQSPLDVMDCVSVAVNIAKNIAKEPFVFFDDTMKEHVRESKEIESLFPNAVRNEEFKVYYQPKVMLKDYRLSGAEALCRWEHNGELMPPYKFIPVFEQSKIICTLDFYMLEHVCRDLRRWMDEGKKVVKVSVNFSRRHLGDMDLLERILAIVNRYQIPHEYIEIELTETTTDVDFKDLRRIVFGLQQEGISASVDDFGIGYSSLNLIRELPWNVLKIDKSFLEEKDNGASQNYLVLKHIIAMAQDMGLECIVEGVETEEHVRILKENNCFLAQGFYFDRPLPREEFEKRLSQMQYSV